MAQTRDEQPLDLEIRILARDARGDRYRVDITLDDEIRHRGYLSTEILSWNPTNDWKSDGRWLFETLFADLTLRDAWGEARGRATQQRIRLWIDTEEDGLHALPWELLHDARRMLSANAETPFSRYLPVALPWSGEVGVRPIRVLGVISNPDDLEEQYDLPPVDVAAERAILADALASAREHVGQDELQLTFLSESVTPVRLQAALRDGYHVVHVVGHGAFSSRREQAALYLQDEAGRAHRLLDSEWESLIAHQSVRPHLMTLIACQSARRSTANAFAGLAPRLVSAGVPAVVAMQDLVTAETARVFASAFYRRLLVHGYVDQAVNEARGTLLAAGRPDAWVPVLFMRLQSGQLWHGIGDNAAHVPGPAQPQTPPPAVSSPGRSSLSPSQRRQIEQRIREAESSLEMHNKLIEAIKRDLALELDGQRKIVLGMKLQDRERERDQVEAELARLEGQL
ncbi:MAG: CHAT domain-containing protein [Anaerolineae bacterium]|nr:CHAT domain-containing protein [Anaerolineae bacterium]